MPSKALKVVPVRLDQKLISLLKAEATRRECGVSYLLREMVARECSSYPKDQTPGNAPTSPGV